MYQQCKSCSYTLIEGQSSCFYCGKPVSDTDSLEDRLNTLEGELRSVRQELEVLKAEFYSRP